MTKEEWDAIADGIMMQESSMGTNIGPRPEPGFQRRYGKKWLREGDAAFRQQALSAWGDQAVYSSYGPYQVMYPVAVELGFRGTPAQLADPVVNRMYFDKKLGRDLAATKGDLDQAFLRYNGGGDKDYPAKIRRHMAKHASTRELQARQSRRRLQGAR